MKTVICVKMRAAARGATLLLLGLGPVSSRRRVNRAFLKMFQAQ